MAGSLLGTGILAAVHPPGAPPREWRVMACDVGQGDAILLRSAGVVALIDTGAEAEPLESCLRAAGVSHIDTLVLTHFDADHAGAAPALAGRVGTVLHGPLDEHADHALGALAAGGAIAVGASAGMTGSLGAARWRVLWPRAGGRGFAPGNDASVVVEVAGGGIPSMLLLGDLSAAPQRALVRSGALHPPYEVVKVAHHGSADQDMSLYALVRPAVGLISVGAGNVYGHPRAETLAALEGLGARVFRMDLDGAVAVWEAEGAVRVWRERRDLPATIGTSSPWPSAATAPVADGRRRRSRGGVGGAR